MKKLWMIAAVCALMLASCGNKEEKAPAPKDMPQQPAPRECQMSDEQKADMKDWDNWANLSEARKTELLNKRKACYDKMKAEQEKREADKAKFEKQMQNWDKLTMEQKKAAFDLVGGCPMKACKEGCQDGAPQCGPQCGPGPQGCLGGDKPCPNDGKAPKNGDKPCCKDKR